jgi:DNA invertase Pin-like site-specific DNA recombinase
LTWVNRYARKLDRLGRSLPRLLNVVGQLRKRGINFTKNIDTTTIQGEFLFNIFASLAGAQDPD